MRLNKKLSSYFLHDFSLQAIYDNAAKELEDKRKEEPPTKLGPISKQIAAKAKLRPGMISYFKELNSINLLLLT